MEQKIEKQNGLRLYCEDNSFIDGYVQTHNEFMNND